MNEPKHITDALREEKMWRYKENYEKALKKSTEWKNKANKYKKIYETEFERWSKL